MVLRSIVRKSLWVGVLVLAGGVASASAEQISVTVQNLQPNDGFFFTPVWLGLHDGSFDLFDGASPASTELETIAETGDAGPLGARFSSATNANGTSRFGTVVTSPAGFAGAPVFDPGESVTVVLDVPDSSSNRYLSLASMVIPSNDAFFGNEDPSQHLLFNADGSFAGPMTIDIFGNGVYDAGTEQNTGMGAAFSAVGGLETDENGTVGLHAGLGNFVGTDTAAGTTIANDLSAAEPLARIQITAVPEPSTMGLCLMGVVALVARGRRRRLARDAS